MKFIFETVRNIKCESGSIKNLGSIMRSLGCKRLLVVTDPGIEKSGVLNMPMKLLGANFDCVELYAKVQADPPENIVLEAIAMAKNISADGIIGIGGGSSLDTAKLVALLASTSQNLNDIYGIGLVKGKRLPLVLVPTTAGTGSEVTPIAIVTTPSAEKKGVVDSELFADFALLDPDLTLSLPSHITAATGVDAMVHAIEAYTSKHLKNPLSDALALQALRLLHANIRRVIRNGKDMESRTVMLQGSLMAGMAFANAPVAAVHALAYPLGAHFHLPHGICNTLMLIPVLMFNIESNPKPYTELAEVIIPGCNQESKIEAAHAFVNEMRSMCSEIGLPLRLRDVEVPESAIPTLAVDAMKVERLLRNNLREMRLDDARRLYQQAW